MIAALPTAQDVARAVAVAARFTGEDPEAILASPAFAQARNYALVALADVFPSAAVYDLAKALKFAEPERAGYVIAGTRRTNWWREGLVDEIVGAIVAPSYRERAL